VLVVAMTVRRGPASWLSGIDQGFQFA
jgi:hypothetical protein